MILSIDCNAVMNCYRRAPQPSTTESTQSLCVLHQNMYVLFVCFVVKLSFCLF